MAASTVVIQAKMLGKVAASTVVSGAVGLQHTGEYVGKVVVSTAVVSVAVG